MDIHKLRVVLAKRREQRRRMIDLRGAINTDPADAGLRSTRA